jgi:ABC-type spermidine/putrescine transport system permease subunit II
LIPGTLRTTLRLARSTTSRLWFSRPATKNRWPWTSPPLRAAEAFGLTTWQKLRYVLWPARRISLLTCGLMCTVLAATEMELSILLAPPGEATLGVRLATLIHTASDAVVSALALDILALVAPLICLLMVLLMINSSRVARNDAIADRLEP